MENTAIGRNSASTGKSAISVFVLMGLFMLFAVLTSHAQTATANDTLKKIASLKKEVVVLKAAWDFDKASSTDAENAIYQNKIDSVKELIAVLSAPAPKAKATPVAKEEKVVEKKIVSIADYQTQTIGKTTNRGERVKMNTVNVSAYAWQNEMSASYSAMQLDQMMKDSMGLMQARFNGIITYNAVGSAARANSKMAPACHVKIVRANNKGVEASGAIANYYELALNEEREIFLPAGTYNVYYEIMGKTVMARNFTVSRGSNNYVWHNKPYDFGFYYDVNNFGNSSYATTYGW